MYVLELRRCFQHVATQGPTLHCAVLNTNSNILSRIYKHLILGALLTVSLPFYAKNFVEENCHHTISLTHISCGGRVNTALKESMSYQCLSQTRMVKPCTPTRALHLLEADRDHSVKKLYFWKSFSLQDWSALKGETGFLPI